MISPETSQKTQISTLLHCKRSNTQIEIEQVSKTQVQNISIISTKKIINNKTQQRQKMGSKY